MSTHEIYSVSRLNREVRALLEGGFPLLWLEGEISNLARPRSGHLYFSLKDEFAQVRCAMFRMKAVNLRFAPRDGMQVMMRVRVGLYEPRGDFQLVVEHMEEAGDGALRRAFEDLKERLHVEGLFAAERKRPIPALPRRIGVLTSPSGAAIHDILTVLKRRFAAIPVVIYPVPVQGEGAAGKIAEAIRLAGQRAECDVLIVGRGGGSLEDLWAFNEEVVARAIHASPIPIVSAVGHEVDVSIADLVADARAPTPSAAAEMLSPDGEKWRIHLCGIQQRLQQGIQRQLQQARQQLQRQRLPNPRRQLQQQAQRLDELEARLGLTLRQTLQHRQQHLALFEAKLQAQNPLRKLAWQKHALQALEKRLHQVMQQQLQQAAHALERLHLGPYGNRLIRRIQQQTLYLQQVQQRHARGLQTRLKLGEQRLASLVRTLETVSPLATLARGYAIVQDPKGHLLQRANQVQAGQQILARLHQGSLLCRVEETYD